MHTDRNWASGGQGLADKGTGVAADACGVLRGDGNVLKLDSGDGCTAH